VFFLDEIAKIIVPFKAQAMLHAVYSIDIFNLFLDRGLGSNLSNSFGLVEFVIFTKPISHCQLRDYHDTDSFSSMTVH